jgi:hypothetical protein
LIDLGPDNFEFWRYIEPIFLAPDEISLFAHTLSFDSFHEDIWHKLFVRLANKPDETILVPRVFNSRTSVKFENRIFCPLFRKYSRSLKRKHGGCFIGVFEMALCV